MITAKPLVHSSIQNILCQMILSIAYFIRDIYFHHMRSLIARAYRSVTPQLSNWTIAVLTLVNITIFAKWCASPTIEVLLGKELIIQQTLGTISFKQDVRIKNTGTKVGYVSKVNAFVRAKNIDQELFKRKLEAKYFVPDGFSFIEMAIMPDEQFHRQIQFYREPDRVSKDSASIITNMMIEEGLRRTPYQQFQSFEVTGKTKSIVENYIKRRTVELKVGEYEYVVEIWIRNESKPIRKFYSFIITPENVSQFKESLKDFTRYYGYMNNYPRPPMYIPLTEIKNSEIEKSLERELIN